MGLSEQNRVSVWTSEEQSLLKELLFRSSSDSREVCYANIADHLKGKNIRDVALRCLWMKKMGIEERRKDNKGSSRKHKYKKKGSKKSHVKMVKNTEQQPNSPSHATNLALALPYAQSSSSMDIDDDVISFKVIGGMPRKLLEQNANAMHQISANLSALKVHDNINLLCKTKNNIITLLEKINNAAEVMKQMPPLPVKLNEELIEYTLPY